MMPAEWAPQSAVMLTWPHAGTDWIDVLDEVEPVFYEIAHATLRFEHLLVSCEDPDIVKNLQTGFNQFTAERELPGRALVVQAPADDTWARDHGPIALSGARGPRLLDFRFNAWGGKFACKKDNALNQVLAAKGAFGQTPLSKVDFILEGGSIESDGRGTLLTTSECLLATTRNHEKSRTEIEDFLKTTLGAHRVLWLNHGYLAGDDTDSHIDTLARFCAPDHIAYVHCDDPGDEHYGSLLAMAEELTEFRQDDGSPYRLTALPWPEPVYDAEGERLPATYANFLIINGAVLVPVYGVPQDEQAVATLAGIFPDREMIPVNCLPLAGQNGSLHCVTMQLPAGVIEL
ncbi:MAG: agmatine deiminase family protein [Oleiphilaceae bacterium]|nr:agmatine deiminase family protein [Oleiphilaceae bacterium]